MKYLSTLSRLGLASRKSRTVSTMAAVIAVHARFSPAKRAASIPSATRYTENFQTGLLWITLCVKGILITALADVELLVAILSGRAGLEPLVYGSPLFGSRRSLRED